ncbi:MAG: hypothetical protein QF662_07615 [Phycisphaerae bacterium]|nr:hypothetical protein [Phycisphaerae bacterium]
MRMQFFATPWSSLHSEEDKIVKLTPRQVDLIAHALTKLADEYDRHPTHSPEEERDYRRRWHACDHVFEKVAGTFQNPELTVNTNKTEQ